MTLDKPTNSKAYARLLMTRIFSKVRESGHVMPPLEYKALAHEAGLNDSQLSQALRELKRDNLIALDNTTMGVRLTPDGVRDGDFWQYKATTVLNNDPQPDSLEEIRAELQHLNKEISTILPGTYEWKWIEARINMLMHRENIMVKETAGTVFNVSGLGARANVNSIDNSTNKISISEANVFHELRSELNANVPDPARRQEIIAIVNELEQARGSSTYTEKLTKFLSVSADVVTIISPYIPMLAALALT